jgi:hypothetical protein
MPSRSESHSRRHKQHKKHKKHKKGHHRHRHHHHHRQQREKKKRGISDYPKLRRQLIWSCTLLFLCFFSLVAGVINSFYFVEKCTESTSQLHREINARLGAIFLPLILISVAALSTSRYVVLMTDWSVFNQLQVEIMDEFLHIFDICGIAFHDVNTKKMTAAINPFHEHHRLYRHPLPDSFGQEEDNAWLRLSLNESSYLPTITVSDSSLTPLDYSNSSLSSLVHARTTNEVCKMRTRRGCQIRIEEVLMNEEMPTRNINSFSSLSSLAEEAMGLHTREGRTVAPYFDANSRKELLGFGLDQAGNWSYTGRIRHQDVIASRNSNKYYVSHK